MSLRFGFRVPPFAMPGAAFLRVPASVPSYDGLGFFAGEVVPGLSR